jgi:hypothetical protein
MMWVSSIMDGNRQEGKWLAIERKALKWVKVNNALPKDHINESLSQTPSSPMVSIITYTNIVAYIIACTNIVICIIICTNIVTCIIVCTNIVTYIIVYIIINY